MAREPHLAKLIGCAVLALAGQTLAGCVSPPRAAQEVPALITQPSDAGRAELARVVSNAMGGVRVTLADDALTRESAFTLERPQLRNASGMLFNGRELTRRVEHFSLLKVGVDCVLVHERSSQRWKLAHSSCVAASTG
jgi:hypothetical protein